jgi:hypothetical protein
MLTFILIQIALLAVFTLKGDEVSFVSRESMSKLRKLVAVITIVATLVHIAGPFLFLLFLEIALGIFYILEQKYNKKD